MAVRETQHCECIYCPWTGHLQTITVVKDPEEPKPGFWVNFWAMAARKAAANGQVPQCAGSLCLRELVWIVHPQGWPRAGTGWGCGVRAFSPVLGQGWAWQQGSWPGPEVSQNHGLQSGTLVVGACLEPGAAGAHLVLGWPGPGARRASLRGGVCASSHVRLGAHYTLPWPPGGFQFRSSCLVSGEGWQRWCKPVFLLCILSFFCALLGAIIPQLDSWTPGKVLSCLDSCLSWCFWEGKNGGHFHTTILQALLCTTWTFKGS